MAKEKLDRRLQIRLKPDQYRLIKEAARLSDMSISTFVRHHCLARARAMTIRTEEEKC